MVVLLNDITYVLRQVSCAPTVHRDPLCIVAPALWPCHLGVLLRTQRSSGLAPAAEVFAAAGRSGLRSLSRAT